ncbi:single-stranded-DNA-specific exonuclease RecJ [Aeoliella sp.]|uniref:single-stranded-DNA-specific exonuclease RecJ n=1 Tax=Aeoliella sp. TaxID=2795800 RepID=UPI003CCBBC64
MPKQWRIATYDTAVVERLAQAAEVSELVARLLVGRGIDCPDAARRFLQAKLTDLRDPSELPGLTHAAELLHTAAKAGKRIVIYGDYDADGMTATAILLRCFRLLHAKVEYYVPHRLEEGYGLSNESLDELASRGAEVVVTVDNGIASLEQADHARQLGIELVVTDHHQMAHRLPEAAAIVHPALPDFDYPFHGLCGAAVAFKLAWGICQLASGGNRVQPAMRAFLLEATGLAAIGTIADVVPLVDENRAIVCNGLRSLSASPSVGIAALKQITELDKKPFLAGDDVGFSIAPRLNAAGRLGQADLAVELLSTEDPKRAAELARFIEELNSERQHIERSVLLAARKQAKRQFHPEQDPAFVLADFGWHAGVIGIVAGKLVEQYNRPVVLISQDKLGIKPAMGSGRSIPGFDLHAAFAECSEHLLSHGGHAAAAGLKIADKSIDAFRQAFCAAAARRLADAARDGQMDIDAEAPFAALTRQTIEDIDKLAPFGCGNRRPVMCASDVRIAGEPRLIGAAGRHVSLELEQHGVRLRAVAFGGGDWMDDFQAARNAPISIAFHPVLNRFRGRVSVEMHLADWRRDD